MPPAQEDWCEDFNSWWNLSTGHMVGLPEKWQFLWTWARPKCMVKASVIKIINKYNIIHTFLDLVLPFNSLVSTAQPIISPAQCILRRKASINNNEVYCALATCQIPSIILHILHNNPIGYVLLFVFVYQWKKWNLEKVSSFPDGWKGQRGREDGLWSQATSVSPLRGIKMGGISIRVLQRNRTNRIHSLYVYHIHERKRLILF